MAFEIMEFELSVVYDKIRSALFVELQDPDWVLLREDRRVIVERKSDDDKDGVFDGDGAESRDNPLFSVNNAEG